MSTVVPVPLTARNAGLAELHALLRDQHARKVDVPVTAAQIHAVGTHLQLIDTPPVLSEAGVTDSTGLYLPTEICDQGLADKLGIPLPYLRRLRAHQPALYEANINTWLRSDDRRFLLRGLRGAGDNPGVARAFLSDRYKIIDNLDVLMAALDGVRLAGVDIDIDGCDLTERKMYVRVVCEQVAALAPELLKNYRSPFTGAAGADNPLVFAGFVISNSETGCGAFTITPRLLVQVCRNGMTITADAHRHVHLGGRLDDGGSAVRWSSDTQDKNLQLITAQTRDAITAFLDTDYLTTKIRELTAAAGAEIADPDKTIQAVTSKLRFTDDQQREILRHFIRGGDLTAGGVMHAVTSVAQALDDADTAHEMEAQALRALHLAAAGA
ncbi:DUF932 domain-containing protein [Microbispora bryophytorum]|uniref:DUF932 domain-containing protein n=1 Tax=Microbispora bryophytorum subsp. camponoti TaxID=1677852 RepID=A0ABR8LBS0_9ACTN|nr:DUF932 domain-containing protein [Microbispora camponoti]MBD3147085.1 DUF932 domain-containing protein [Microbispora camponoti]